MKEELERRDARVLVIGGGTAMAARMAARLLRLPFPVLHDPDRTVYRAYGFERKLGMIQQSGTVVVDREGILRYRTAGVNPFDALDRTALLAALDAPETA